MNMIQDTINSLRATLNERIGNPFLSASLIACMVWNWKLSLLLFSDVPYDSKIEKIVNLYPDNSSQFHNFFIVPLCFGLFWTFVWPLISLGINTYWYRMKSHITNAKLKAERKKLLSEAEAAELYSMIDAQGGKYLELLKDRQGKINGLTEQLDDTTKSQAELAVEMTELISKHNELEQKLSGTERELSVLKESSLRVNLENDEHRRLLADISERSIEFAEYLPGLKAITNAINKTTNYQANEAWIWEEFKRQEKSFPSEAQQLMLNFFLAIGLIKREANGNITFGDRYRYNKDKVLGMHNNSAGITVL
jgi:hypothetical protein